MPLINHHHYNTPGLKQCLLSNIYFFILFLDPDETLMHLLELWALFLLTHRHSAIKVWWSPEVLQQWFYFWKVPVPSQQNYGSLSEWPSGFRSATPFLIAQLGWMANSRKCPSYVKLLPFKNDEGHCVLAPTFLYPSLDLCLNTILSRRSVPSTTLLCFCSEMYCQLCGLI